MVLCENISFNISKKKCPDRGQNINIIMFYCCFKEFSSQINPNTFKNAQPNLVYDYSPIEKPLQDFTYSWDKILTVHMPYVSVQKSAHFANCQI